MTDGQTFRYSSREKVKIFDVHEPQSLDGVDVLVISLICNYLKKKRLIKKPACDQENDEC